MSNILSALNKLNCSDMTHDEWVRVGMALKAEGYGDEEDRDEYLADNIFWVPKEARWETIKAHAILLFSWKTTPD